MRRLRGRQDKQRALKLKQHQLRVMAHKQCDDDRTTHLRSLR